MGRPRPGALGYRESSFGWEGCCSGVWCRAARTSSLAAGRWHSATGVEACEEQDGSAAGRLGAHRGRPPRRLGVRSWTATEAPVDVEDRGAPMAQPLRGRSAGLPPHVDPPPLLAVSLSTRPCSSCLTGEFYLAHHCRAASPSLPEEKQLQLTEDGMLTTPTEKVGRCGAGDVEARLADVYGLSPAPPIL